MRYVQAHNMTFLQKVILFLLVSAFLVGAFFLAMALLPLIIVAIFYIWYKFRKTAKQFREAQERMYQDVEFQESAQQDYARNYIHIEQNYHEENNAYENGEIYDISPNDYTFDDKEDNKN